MKKLFITIAMLVAIFSLYSCRDYEKYFDVFKENIEIRTEKVNSLSGKTEYLACFKQNDEIIVFLKIDSKAIMEKLDMDKKEYYEMFEKFISRTDIVMSMSYTKRVLQNNQIKDLPQFVNYPHWNNFNIRRDLPGLQTVNLSYYTTGKDFDEYYTKITIPQNITSDINLMLSFQYIDGFQKNIFHTIEMCSILSSNNLEKKVENNKTHYSEKENKYDSKPPKNYIPPFGLNGTQSYNEYRESDYKLDIFRVKSLGGKTNKVKAYVHLFDKDGKFIKGGGKNLQWWCGFDDLINEKIYNPKFSVLEVNNDFKIDYKFAIISDISGSMGDDRVAKVKNSIKDFIALKYDNHEISLVDFNHEVILNSQLSNSKSNLNNRIGSYSCGGGTDILMALNQGLNELISPNDKTSNKAAILFTDGQSDESYKLEMIKLARENNISIYTIAFGEGINESFLNELSYMTGGKYYRIYDRNMIKDIFKDIHYRLMNYYVIEFDTEEKGWHSILLNVCLKNRRLKASESFFNGDLPEMPDKENSGKNVGSKDYSSEIENCCDRQSTIVERYRIIRERAKNTIDREKERIGQVINEIRNITDNIPGASIELVNMQARLLLDNEILFEQGKYTLQKKAEIELIKIINVLNAERYSDLDIYIEGHTNKDPISTACVRDNWDLSALRSATVAALMTKSGIAPERLTPSGFSYFQPKYNWSDPKAWAGNRRTEIIITFGVEKAYELIETIRKELN